ncbi:MAG: hypothetical protein PWR14_21 [Thermosediminibacterales bacterium]|nr:hypothetical protein [Thermosediminibacterales bacterium]
MAHGWGGRTRTYACGSQSPVPYRLGDAPTISFIYIFYLVERGGFEPPKAKPADLQSAPFGQLGNLSTWSRWWDLNPQPADYKSAALPIELHRLFGGPTWTRTRDQPVMSRLLYQLSYRPVLVTPRGFEPLLPP